ncbi:MAG: DUF6785 family protein [Armatimonadota bacterium]|nr:DUF6785 family protein [Armatimonadota bacterium]
MGARFGLTWRSILIGIIASAFLGDWSQYAELIIHGTQITLTYPPIGGFLVFIVIYALFNVILRAIHRAFTLTQAELVVIFTMIVMASGIASIDLAQKLIPMMVGPYYYASAENQYALFFLPHIEPWLAPTEPQVVKGLFEAWGFGVPWRAWLVPLGAWTAFTMATYVLMLSVVTIFRKQWIDRERLLFPLVAVPLEVTEPAPRRRLLNDFFRDPIMWIGLVLGFAPHLYYGLHGYYPGLPRTEIFRIGGKRVPTYAWGRPWSAMGTLRFQVAPLIIGLSFLLTREVSFSLWAFYWLGRLEAVLGTAVGLDGLTITAGGDSFPFPGHQTAGAYLALAGVSIWIARRPLAEIVMRGLALRKTPEDEVEPLSYRVAVWGGIISFAFMVLWANQAGMPVLVAVPLLLVAFGYLLAMTRLVSEGGMPWMDEPHWRAHDIIRALVPYRSISVANWASVAMMLTFTHDMRVSPMPRIMQSLKLSEETDTGDRAITWGLVIATVVAIPVSYWALLEAGYVHGGVAINTYRFISLARQPGELMERLQASPVKSRDWLSLGLIGYGVAKLLFLSFMRISYLWWPLHPVGYAMSYIVYLPREWLSILIGWACQTVLMRYAGHRGFRRYRPLFLGLILGAMLAGGFWLVIDGFTGLRDHKILY